MKKIVLYSLFVVIILNNSIITASANANINENLTIYKKSWVTVEENGQINIKTILIFPMNIRGTFRSDAIDSKFNLTNITIGYGGEIIGDYTELQNIGLKDVRKTDNYTIRILNESEGKFKTIESYLSIEGSKDKLGIAYFEYYLNKSLDDSESILLNLQNTMPTMKGEKIDYVTHFMFVSHKKSTYGILRKLGGQTSNESWKYPSPDYTTNGFSYTFNGKTKEAIGLLFNQIDIVQIKDYRIDVFENWTIENKNETYYHINITVTTKSNSSWPFYHAVAPGLSWRFSPVQKPENFFERPGNTFRAIKSIDETGQWVISKFMILENPSLENLNLSEVPLDIFDVPDTLGAFRTPYSGIRSDLNINRTIFIEYDIPKSEFNRFSTGVRVEYNWISSVYQKKILLKSNDDFFSTQPYDREYSKEGYIFTKERNLIGSSENLVSYEINRPSLDATTNTTIESNSTSLDVFEIKIPETKTESYIENVSISTFDPVRQLITASINTKETRLAHIDKKNVTVQSYLYAVADPMNIKIRMTKPYKIDDFGLPYDYKEILKEPNPELELNQLYVYEEKPLDWYALFKIDRKNENRVDFELDYSSNLSSSLSIQPSFKFWEPKKWKLKYEKIFPPGRFPGFAATTVFNIPEQYQFVGANEGGHLEGNNAIKFVSPTHENFTAKKVMEIYFISKAEKVNKEFLVNKFALLLLISATVLIILQLLSMFKDDFGIIKKLIPFLITFLFIQFLEEMPPSIPRLYIIIYLIIFLIILFFIVKRYSKGLISDVRSSIEKLQSR